MPRPARLNGVFFARTAVVKMTGSIARWLSAAAFAVRLSAPHPVLAAAPTPVQLRAAADAYDRGSEAYRAEQWVAAAEQFEAADGQAPSATAIEYAMRARDRAGQLDRAATLAAIARARYQDETSTLGKLTSDVLSRARSSLYQLTVHCSEPCELALAGKLVSGPPELQRLVFLAPGQYVLQAGFADQRSAAAEVTATAAGVGELSFELPALPPAPPPPPPVMKPSPTPVRHQGLSPLVFWVGAGLTVVGAGAITWSGLDTLAHPGKSAVRSCDPEQGADCPAYQQGLANQRRTNILIGATAGVGVVTAVIGALFTDWHGKGNAARVGKVRSLRGELELEPVVAIGSGTWLGVQGRF